jgi:hypothetical protein
MRAPALFRTTTFRLTLLFLALFASAAAAFLAYLYLMTAGDVARLTDAEISRQVRDLDGVYARGGVEAVRRTMMQRTAIDAPFLYLLLDRNGRRIWGTIDAITVPPGETNIVWTRVKVAAAGPDPEDGVGPRLARGQRQRLSGGETMFVGDDLHGVDAYVLKIAHALWGAGVLVVVLGLTGGVLVSRNVNRSLAGLNSVVAAVRGGELGARVALRGAKDEFARPCRGCAAGWSWP